MLATDGLEESLACRSSDVQSSHSWPCVLPTAVVQFENVCKIYGSQRWRPGVQALSNVTLSINAGEVFGLLGPNRAGKTTLLKILVSTCRPTSGRVTRFGLPPDRRSTLARVGYVHENPAFPLYLTAAELLEYYGALSQMPRAVLRKKTPLLLEQVGLADRHREQISRFSKGMLQRLALAQALINEPELLVLDEPTEGLDQMGRRLVHDVVHQQRQQGKTTLVVSHLIHDIEQLCDRVGVLVQGRLVAVERVSDLTRDPATGGDLPLDAVLVRLYEEHA